LANNQVLEELVKLYQEVANLVQLLDDIERQTFIQSLSQEVRNNLPNPNQNEVFHLERLYAIKPEEEDI
jgi:hypothetical protein